MTMERNEEESRGEGKKGFKVAFSSKSTIYRKYIGSWPRTLSNLKAGLVVVAACVDMREGTEQKENERERRGDT